MWMEPSSNGIILTVRLVPRASRNEIAGEQGDALRIRLQAPPVDGKANKALIEFLAEVLDVPRSAVSIESGATSRMKRVRINGIQADRAMHLLTTPDKA